MPSPSLKCVSTRRENTHKVSWCEWEEIGSVDGSGKVKQERIKYADGAKVTEKRCKKNRQMGG